MRATMMVVTQVSNWVAQRPAPVHAKARRMVWSAGFAFSNGKAGAASSAAISIGLLGSGSKQGKTSKVAIQCCRLQSQQHRNCHHEAASAAGGSALWGNGSQSRFLAPQVLALV